ncbi:sugar phosphate isomerase/epimerase family protein [Confluentibacter citreus]|uniref:sugar phosphate isomerase/epimerase family protein n=1 Tax=Confluentibacter citreus TaxID=2007307 RepID=UPI000C28B782|nr:sugar phosphate isomerase/epimerase family protein [Confluentibacter citreus]
MKSLYNCFTALLAFSILCLSCKSGMAQELKKEKKQDIVFGLNAYSFCDLMEAKDPRDKEQMYSLLNLLDWCDYQGIKALDPTGYFFPTYPKVPSDDYLANFKNRAHELGIAISGTGIRNNFASPDPKVRAEGVALAKQWIVAASKLGAPVLRVFAGAIPKGYEDNWEEPAGWMIECYKELLPMAEQYNVKIGIQNHGEMLQTAEQCLYVLNRVNSKWAGIIVDTGNFTTDDPYKDIQALVPYAINWQVKEFTDGYGGTTRTDYKKLVKIIKDGGYKGYVPVETLKVRGDFYDPFQRVENMLTQLNAALEAISTDKKQ